MKVCFGGTFERIHAGHRRLIRKAFQLGDEVFIGITSDSFAQKRKSYNVSPLEERKKRLILFLRAEGYSNYHIAEIEDEFGPAVEGDFDMIIVSEGTVETARELNKRRREMGLKPLSITMVSHVLAQDCTPIKSSRILSGEIDEEGTLLRPVVVNVGSKEKVEIWSARDVFMKVFEKIEIHGIAVPSDVPDQPWDEDPIQCAVRRAKACLKDADFGVGVASGLLSAGNEPPFVRTYCAIVDKRNELTLGHSAGYVPPGQPIEQAKKGTAIEKARGELSEENLEDSGGAIDYWSLGMIKENDLMRQAIAMALIPRLRRGLYHEKDLLLGS